MKATVERWMDQFDDELIRHRQQDRERLRALLLAGKASRIAGTADAAYFSRLRERALSRVADVKPRGATPETKSHPEYSVNRSAAS